MLKKDFMAMDLAALHDKVEAILPAWLADPENRLVRSGNAKTGTIGRFGRMYKTKGLVIHDCPGASEGCRKACQMLAFACWRTEDEYVRAWESVYSYLAHRDLPLLKKVLKRDIGYLSATATIIIRMHEAGDFINEAHARVYLELAREFPLVRFFGYTHSAHVPGVLDVLVEANQLANFMVRESLDETRLEPTGKLPVAYYGPRAKAPKNFARGKKFAKPNPNNPYPAPAGYMNCPEQYGDHKTKCADCMLCLTNPLDVFFISQLERIKMEKTRNDKLREAGVEVERRYGTPKKLKERRAAKAAEVAAALQASQEKAS